MGHLRVRLAGVWACAGMVLASLLAVPPASAEVIDRVLAVVGGEIITLSDVRAARELGRVQVDDAAEPVRAALRTLIDRALILAEAERYAPPEPGAAEIDRAYDALARRAGARAALPDVLTRLGVDERYVRELLREDLRIRAYLDQRFTADTPEQQQRMVSEWLDAVRRRADVIEVDSALTPALPGTAGPVRH